MNRFHRTNHVVIAILLTLALIIANIEALSAASKVKAVAKPTASLATKRPAQVSRTPVVRQPSVSKPTSPARTVARPAPAPAPKMPFNPAPSIVRSNPSAGNSRNQAPKPAIVRPAQPVRTPVAQPPAKAPSVNASKNVVRAGRPIVPNQPARTVTQPATKAPVLRPTAPTPSTAVSKNVVRTGRPIQPTTPAAVRPAQRVTTPSARPGNINRPVTNLKNAVRVNRPTRPGTPVIINNPRNPRIPVVRNRTVVPKITQRPFFTALAVLAAAHVVAHQRQHAVRNTFIFNTNYSRHTIGHFERGYDITPFHTYYRSPWYMQRYRYWHLPIGGYVIPYGHRHHYYYNFTQTSYVPTIIYVENNRHVFDADGFCTLHEHHHYAFDSEKDYQNRLAAVLEYWWVDDPTDDRDNLRFLLDVADSSRSGRPLDYAELIVEARTESGWEIVLREPADTTKAGYRNNDSRLRFEIEIDGSVLVPDVDYRASIQAVYRESYSSIANYETSNYANFEITERNLNTSN